MSRFILPGCCLLLLTLTAARAEDARPLATFSMGPDRMPFVTLSFGGKDYQCLLDTGTPISRISERFAPALGEPAKASSGSPVYALPAASIGGLQLPAGTVVMCANLDEMSRSAGTQLDGILGMSTLAHTAVELNFDEGVVRLYEPNANVHLKLRESIIDRLFAIGAASVIGKIEKTNPARGRELTRYGLVALVEFSKLEHEFVLYAENLDARVDGSVGSLFLARYNSTLVFPRRELTLRKSRWHDARWWPDLRGMTVAEIGGRPVVFSVRRNSAAFSAGVRPEDEIDLPPGFDKSIHLWRSTEPLDLRIRKPDSAAFEAVRLAAFNLPASQAKPSSNGRAAEPLR